MCSDMKSFIQEALKINIKLTEDQLEKISCFVKCLIKWNKTHNLTAIVDYKKILTHHILDSISISEHIGSGNVLDVGTGPGFPGVPLAILHPDTTFYVLDSKNKKIDFIEYAVLKMGLKNVIPVCSRIEAFSPDVSFDYIVSRAFSSLESFVSVTSRLVADKTQLLAMKGKRENIDRCPDGFKVERVENIYVPALQAERTLVFIRKAG